MNRFDDHYIFRYALLNDCDTIMNFLWDEWPKKNHILAENKRFFLYEFQNGTRLNFVIATHRDTGRLDGVIGYLPASDIKDPLDVWTCMWLTRRKGSMPFLGLEILNRMKDIIGFRCQIGVGTNSKTALPLAKNKANQYIYKMNHYYRLSGCEDYKIAKISSPVKLDRPDVKQFTLEPIHSINGIEACLDDAGACSIPLKNAWYMNKRFFGHPIYTYLVWAIVDSGEKKGFLVGREIALHEKKVLRVVDFWGEQELVGGLFDAFGQLLNVGAYEYVDFYILGVDDVHLRNAGFVHKTEEDPNIIPNYFEPFVQSNIDIYGTSTIPDVRMCKADADQDRPNTVST